jgi:hypothetical protein
MGSHIESFGSLPSLDSIEQSVKSLQGVLSEGKVAETAQHEAKAWFGGLANSLERICTQTIANSENISLESLKKSYSKIGNVYTIMRDVGKDLSVETQSVADQVDLLSHIIKNK